MDLLKACNDNVLDFNYDLNIKENIFDLDIEKYLDLAVRNNNKRRFLFISKTLGKHLPCNADDMDNLGKLIVKSYESKLDYLKNPVVISFAETGTALGHSVFNYLNCDCEFIHTTREKVDGKKTLDFLEEHSHATNHNLYYEDLKNFHRGEEIILVDDEITTGNTCMNLIKKINEIYPKKRYTICSILNWMDEICINKYKKLEEQLNIKIEFVYLFRGDFDFKCDESKIQDLILKKELEGNALERTHENIKEDIRNNIKTDIKIKYIDLNMDKYKDNSKYLSQTGRFGMDKNAQKRLLKSVKNQSKRLNVNKYEKTLFLGSEEFMYIPMQFAKQFGKNVYYHSTTRSPIVDFDEGNYPIKSRFCHHSLYNKDVLNYVYNIDKYNYNECFFFSELNIEKDKFDEIVDIIASTNIKKLNIVICNN